MFPTSRERNTRRGSCMPWMATLGPESACTDTSAHYESPAPNSSGNTLTWNALIPTGIIPSNTAAKHLEYNTFSEDYIQLHT